MKPARSAPLGVVLVNLGTPDAPTPEAVRRYLRQFLSDRRVIEIPPLVWKIILNLFILPFRPKRVAGLYASIWEKSGDSPMRRILREQAMAVQERLQGDFPAMVRVEAAMTYGNPSLPSVLDKLRGEGVEQIVILPLFPQFSATSTAPVYDALQRWTAVQRNLPSLTIIKDYFAHPGYIGALVSSIREYREQHGTSDKLLFSFHGIPQPYADKGDPYPKRCRCTSAHVAQQLGLREDQWAISFQSRFGKQEWVKPYTDVLLEDWAKSGVGSVQVVSPAFSADCLETLEELAIQNQELFLHAGGRSYAYIPGLNTRDDHIKMMVDLVRPSLQAFRQTQGWD
ncbi:ferrochelatase [Fluviicoccus keumensis]|uniref:Ferrochelatase n=1 Tax=Fluviicoccus keumensis TaxID=1435465 RepID=A0A4Q7YJV0_9GAMM|nr:ferrochelatase [Fluviicoccus keumensis]RZU37144.1 ferrochelatase [Fluviicoccus keumensis]